MDGLEFIKFQKEEAVHTSFVEFFNHWKNNEHILFVLPHDDDLQIGAGLMLMCLHNQDIPFSIVITTDGSMGYCSEEQKKDITTIRKKEFEQSLNILGIKNANTYWCDYPDCLLFMHTGRKKNTDSPYSIKGYTGLQNTYTEIIRNTQATRIFVCTGEDYHPDHKTVYHELLISIFHAGGNIWPELGTPIQKLPQIYEMAVYCDFSEKPNLCIKANDTLFNKKLESIYAFKSQEQIEQVVHQIKENGPYEMFRELEFNLFSPKKYLKHFGLL